MGHMGLIMGPPGVGDSAIVTFPSRVRALTFTQSRSPSQRQCEVTAGLAGTLAGTTRWLFCSSGDRARGLSPMPRTKDEARHPLGPVPITFQLSPPPARLQAAGQAWPGSPASLSVPASTPSPVRV